MALADNVTGDGILVSKDTSSRIFHEQFGFFGEQRIRETTVTEVREWVALTQAAAEGYAAPDNTATVSYSSSAAEDVRVIGSYTVRLTSEEKTYAVVSTT